MVHQNENKFKKNLTMCHKLAITTISKTPYNKYIQAHWLLSTSKHKRNKVLHPRAFYLLARACSSEQ